MPKRSHPTSERAPDQTALNKYLGTKDTRPHQRTLTSLLTQPHQPRPLFRAPSLELNMAIKDEQAGEDVQMKEEQARKSIRLLVTMSSNLR